ncbi:hypothetical protein GN331_16455 [Lysobacter sp. HX-5-24]|uniref:Integron Cassette Protein Hfx-Cass5 domain-containing protein n=2 Tax=Noviluteimonas gilva TaxID=2682097 RepID=A0A7C9HPH2_9GAMM|nr:hypothetical protein [Lysobacter gilvus]
MQVWIRSVAIDDQGLLQVEPALWPDQDLRYIWRTATGVRWNEESGTLQPVAGSSSAHTAWMRRIVEAVRGEYGIELVTREQTVWRNVPANVIDELKAAATPDVGSLK